MLKSVRIVFCTTVIVVSACSSALAVEVRHGILVGTVLKVDAAAKTAVIKAADGTEHTFQFLGRTVVHGTTVGAMDAFHGLKTGSEVAVTYTAKGAKETAEEVDHIGKDGLKASEATVTHIDRGARTLAVKTADGTVETYRMTENAAKFAGSEVAEGTGKSAKATIYYTEEAGHMVAHFFKVLI